MASAAGHSELPASNRAQLAALLKEAREDGPHDQRQDQRQSDGHSQEKVVVLQPGGRTFDAQTQWTEAPYLVDGYFHSKGRDPQNLFT